MRFSNIRKVVKFFDYSALALLTLTFCIAMNYVSENVGGGGLQIPQNVTTWLSAMAFMLVAVLRLSFSRRIQATSVFLLQLACVGLLLLPLLYTDTLFLDVVSLRMAGLGAGVLFLLSLYQGRRRFLQRNLLGVLFVSTIIQTLWGVVQYYFIFESGPLFWRPFEHSPFGIFQQVNVFSIYLAMGALLAIYFGFCLPDQKNSDRPFYQKVLFVLLVAVNFHLIMLSQADTARVVGIFSLLVYSLLALLQIKNKSWIAAVFLVAFAMAFMPKSLFEFRPGQGEVQATQSVKAEATERDAPVIGQQSTIDEHQKGARFGTRTTIYSVAILMVLDEPWVGHGVGSFPKKYLEYQAPYLEANPDAPAQFDLGHAHNEVLQWTVELGLVAAAAFVFLLIVWVLGMKRQTLDPFVLLLAMPLVFQSMLELPFYHSAAHFLAFVSILFAADRSRRKSLKVPKLSGLIVVPAAGYGAFIVSIFMLSTLYALSMFNLFYDSGRENIRLLTQINNPAAFKLRYEFELFQWKLRQATKTGQIAKADVLNYIKWAYSTTQYAPMETTYESFVRALELYGNDKAALDYASEGSRLYPYNDVLLNQKVALINKMRTTGR